MLAKKHFNIFQHNNEDVMHLPFCQTQSPSMNTMLQARELIHEKNAASIRISSKTGLTRLWKIQKHFSKVQLKKLLPCLVALLVSKSQTIFYNNMMFFFVANSQMELNIALIQGVDSATCLLPIIPLYMTILGPSVTLTNGCLKVHGKVPIVLCIFVDPLQPRNNCLVFREYLITLFLNPES